MLRRLEGDLLEAIRRNKGSLIWKVEENMKNASVLNQESAYSRYVCMWDFCIEKKPHY